MLCRNWAKLPHIEALISQFIKPVMDNLPEESMWSFVVRIWLEDIVENNQPHWRGHITHVNGNERRYFDDLEDMKQFVRSFLEASVEESQQCDK